MDQLTQRQSAILQFIQAAIADDGRPPTIREIARHFGFASPRAASDHVSALERKGHLKRTPGHSARSIRITNQAPSGIPLLGRVAAGVPMEAVENYDGHIDVNSQFAGRDHFAVQVRGDSMRDAGILDGDCAIIRTRPTVPDGAIGVAIVDGEATVKRIFKTATGYRLQPANDAYQPIEVEAMTGVDFRIAGPVVGIIRTMK